VDRDLRASLVAACAAAALSALVGIFAGVGFFSLLFRAFGCGLAIGAAAYGGIVVLRRALPGMLDADDAREDAGPAPDLAAAPEMGANVDIVLPGEPIEPESLAPGVESFAPSLASRGADEPAFAEPAFIDEPSLLEPEDQVAEAEPAIPARAGARASPNAGPGRESRPSLGFDELDVLPDLDGFADSFTASEFAFGGSPAERPERVPAVGGGSGGGTSASRPGQEGLDPAALAQAVRTILKRDQKG
jgi:hypothetical protein